MNDLDDSAVEASIQQSDRLRHKIGWWIVVAGVCYTALSPALDITTGLFRPTVVLKGSGTIHGHDVHSSIINATDLSWIQRIVLVSPSLWLVIMIVFAVPTVIRYTWRVDGATIRDDIPRVTLLLGLWEMAALIGNLLAYLPAQAYLSHVLGFTVDIDGASGDVSLFWVSGNMILIVLGCLLSAGSKALNEVV